MTVTVPAIGGTQLATGGGHVQAFVVVTTAGSADAVATLYDGTSTSGIPLATFSLAAVGPAMMPNSSFATGLFVNVVGTTAGSFNVTFAGDAG